MSTGTPSVKRNRNIRLTGIGKEEVLDKISDVMKSDNIEVKISSLVQKPIPRKRRRLL